MPCGPEALVSDLGTRLETGEVAAHFVDHEGEVAVQSFDRVACDVWGQEDGAQSDQRRVQGDRFWVVHVDAEPGVLLAGLGDQGLEVDDLAAGDIHEDGIGGQQSELWAADHSRGGWCSRDEADDDVAAHDRRQWCEVDRQSIGQLSWRVGVSGILVTPKHRRLFADALTNCSLTTVLLQAQPDPIRARILRRRQVEAAEQQTTLSDTVLQELHDYGDRSARFAALLEAGGFSDLSISTDDGTPAQIATQALDRLLPPAV